MNNLLFGNNNSRVIKNLGNRYFKSSKSRNIIAIIAIALTAVLFTSLFTVAMSINKSFEESNFRQAGGYAHGVFKYLTKEQYDDLKDDPLIKAYGMRRFIGIPYEAPFNKVHVELGYSDANNAKWMFLDPIDGRLPKEGTNEAATDTRVLELLGVEPVLGNEFTITCMVNGTSVTETFTLCGYWKYDAISNASHVLLPQSRAQAIFDQIGLGTNIGSDRMTGSYGMDVMLGSSLHIQKDLDTIIANKGYLTNDMEGDGTRITTGVNWSYTGAQLSDKLDLTTIASIAAMLLLIIFTGYLIIYNVFQISVSGDIRFYGLLKTIGTTGRQIKKIIRRQAMLLSLIGIPIGLLIGYGVGVGITPLIMRQLNGVVTDVVSINPLIFLASALFALITVLLSCLRPGRMAARVSPIEAVRYTEASKTKKELRRAQSGASLSKMAWANIGRHKGKTAVTIISLSLAVVLLNMTVTFTNGFDMDKYLRDVKTDFQIADASYFQTGSISIQENGLPESLIDLIKSQPGFEAGGRMFAQVSAIEQFVTEEFYRDSNSRWSPPEVLEKSIAAMERSQDGLLADRAQISGMDDFLLDKLTVLEGDLSALKTPGSTALAAVYMTDDYNNPYMDSHWAKLGDTVRLRYVSEFAYLDPETGEKITDEQLENGHPYVQKALKYEEKEYTVAALVTVPNKMSYRYYGTAEFIMNPETFQQDSGTSSVLYYGCDVSDDQTAAMETFMSDLTEKQMTQFDYQSKATFVAEFESFRGMFLMLGGVLSFIVGLVGILNFLNAILTGILSRRRELAVLQAIGMTNRQLKTMLIWEGVFYALCAAGVSLVLCSAAGPLLSNVLGNMFWFFTYRFTIAPVLMVTPLFVLLGVLLPLLVYRSAAKRSVVERLRETE